MAEPVTVPGIPLALRPWATRRPGASRARTRRGRSQGHAPTGSFRPTRPGPCDERSGTRRRGDRDYLLAARVSVGFAATYDAGVLALHVGERCWAKLCFERAPDGTPMVVSVVTRDVSDDSPPRLAANQVWLRIARRRPAFAFHHRPTGASGSSSAISRSARARSQLWLPGPVSDRRGLHCDLRRDPIRGRTARRHPQRRLVPPCPARPA